MNNDLSHLESLARMTRENSAEGRQQLLREVTDMFMSEPESLSAREVAYFGEIMGKIVVNVEVMMRQHLSETISSVSNAPHDLVASLANDQIEVALPVLVSSEVLDEDELVKIVGKHSQEHLKAISMRASVSEKVTDALVVKGNDNVLETLADNQGARFSSGGMQTIVDRARNNENLNQKLVSRNDVPDDMAKEMFWRVSWAMREQIIGADGELDEAEVDKLMKETEQWFAAEEARRSLNPAEKFIDRKEKLKQLDCGLLLQLLREDKIPEFVAGVSRLAKVDGETARQAVFDSVGEKMAVICKSLDMDYDMFGEVLIFTNFEGKRSDDDIKGIMGVYKRFTNQVAQRSMRFLRTRKVMRKQITETL